MMHAFTFFFPSFLSYFFLLLFTFSGEHQQSCFCWSSISTTHTRKQTRIESFLARPIPPTVLLLRSFLYHSSSFILHSIVSLHFVVVHSYVHMYVNIHFTPRVLVYTWKLFALLTQTENPFDDDVCIYSNKRSYGYRTISRFIFLLLLRKQQQKNMKFAVNKSH